MLNDIMILKYLTGIFYFLFKHNVISKMMIMMIYNRYCSSRHIGMRVNIGPYATAYICEIVAKYINLIM